MTRSRSKLGRFVDNMRRNVLSYKYLKHNIMMTALVAVIAVCVFAVISFGENADPLADELYANDSVTVAKSEAVMMASGSVEMAVDAAVPADSYVSANNTARVASSASGNDTVKTTETVTTETATEDTTEDPQVMNGVTASVLYDGVDVVSSEAADASYVATVNSGEVFDVVSQDESWIGVQLYDGSIGYLSLIHI